VTAGTSRNRAAFATIARSAASGHYQMDQSVNSKGASQMRASMPVAIVKGM